MSTKKYQNQNIKKHIEKYILVVFDICNSNKDIDKSIFFRCGSLQYEVIIVTDKENVAQLSKELAATSDNIMYDGNNVTVSTLTVNNVDGMAFNA